MLIILLYSKYLLYPPIPERMTESRYIEKKAYLSRYTHERMLAFREAAARHASDSGNEEEWLRSLQQDLPKFVPFLTKKCGLEFRGRILEIGAGGAWLSAEISKLPRSEEHTSEL